VRLRRTDKNGFVGPVESVFASGLSQQLSQPPLYLRKALLQLSNFSFKQGVLLLQLSVSTLQFSLTPQEFLVTRRLHPLGSTLPLLWGGVSSYESSI